MRALVQRVSRAAVRVDGETHGEIGPGLLVLLGIAADDDESRVQRMAEFVHSLDRRFEHPASLNETGPPLGGPAFDQCVKL